MEAGDEGAEHEAERRDAREDPTAMIQGELDDALIHTGAVG